MNALLPAFNLILSPGSDPSGGEFGKRGHLLRWPLWIRVKDPVVPPGRRTFATWKQ